MADLDLFNVDSGCVGGWGEGQESVSVVFFLLKKNQLLFGERPKFNEGRNSPEHEASRGDDNH